MSLTEPLSFAFASRAPVARRRTSLHLAFGWLAGGLLVGLVGSACAATIVQTANDGGVGWNSATLWGGSAPTAGNSYVTAGGFYALNDSHVGASTTGRLRYVTVGSTFGGDSLTVITNTEVLVKTGGTMTGNIILNGGIIRSSYAPSGGFTLAGTLNVATVGWVGVDDNDAPTMMISATLSGAGMLHIASGREVGTGNNTIRFTGNLSAFTGTLNLGGGSFDAGVTWAPAMLDFDQDYSLAGAALRMGDYPSVDTLNLDQNLLFGSFTFAGTPLAAGTYTAASLNALFGNGSQFIDGGGTLTIGGPDPHLITQPASVLVYTNGTARMNVAALGSSLKYQWRKDGVALTDDSTISGATNANLVITSVTAANAGNYTVVITNSSGSVTSSVAAVTLVTPYGGNFEAAALTAQPVAYFELNELGDPATNALAYDFIGGRVGTYGTGVLNGNPTYDIAGPRPSDGYPGFTITNQAARFQLGNNTSQISIPALNLNTNTVTLAAWVNPANGYMPNAGVVFCRGGGTVSGLNYSANTDLSGNSTLGYTWNADAGTYTWNSGLVPAVGQWSFVALVVTSTNATLYVMSSNSVQSAVLVRAHANQSFSVATLIGNDSLDVNGARVFDGTVDDVAVFNRALTRDAVATLYSAGSGISVFPPTIISHPQSTNLYEFQTAQFSVTASGTEPIGYRWMRGVNPTFTNLVNGGKISGVNSNTLSISNLALDDAADYVVVVTNAYGSTTSSVAFLTVMATSPAENITLSSVQTAGTSWDTTGWWSDGLSATESAAAKPGSTYEVLTSARLRTPEAGFVTFPGDLLTVDGDGVWGGNAASLATIGEILFKQNGTDGRVFFKRLVMNGGQLNQGSSTDTTLTLQGRLDILANTPIYNNSATAERGVILQSWLTGTGAIEYHAINQNWSSAWIRTLNVTGTTNTFSGPWNIVAGTLLGSGVGSLGTNSITIGTNAAFEVGYDLNSPQATLTLDGRMYLHQNVTFHRVYVGGVQLSAGVHTVAELSANYPNAFPATWTLQDGSSVAAASGTLTVLDGPVSVTLQVQTAPGGLVLSWPQGTLLQATNVTGPWVTNAAASPFTNNNLTAPQMFYRVQVQ